MMGLDTPETCRVWRNILRIICARSWFFFTRWFELLKESNVFVTRRPIVILPSSIITKQQTPQERYRGWVREYCVNPAIWRDYFRITGWKSTLFSAAFVCNLACLTGIIRRIRIRIKTGLNRSQWQSSWEDCVVECAVWKGTWQTEHCLKEQCGVMWNCLIN